MVKEEFFNCFFWGNKLLFVRLVIRSYFVLCYFASKHRIYFFFFKVLEALDENIWEILTYMIIF